MPSPVPMQRPRILFWSRQNSNVGALALLGIKLPSSASIFTISRLGLGRASWRPGACFSFPSPLGSQHTSILGRSSLICPARINDLSWLWALWEL
jgi:hypothetical protein